MRQLWYSPTVRHLHSRDMVSICQLVLLNLCYIGKL